MFYLQRGPCKPLTDQGNAYNCLQTVLYVKATLFTFPESSLSLRKYNVHLDFKNHDGQRIFWIFKLYVKPAAFRDQTVRQF